MPEQHPITPAVPVIIGVDLAEAGTDQTSICLHGHGSITLADAALAMAAAGIAMSYSEIARLLKREGFVRTGHVGSGPDRSPLFTRMRATRQQLDAAHPNRHLPKGNPHA